MQYFAQFFRDLASVSTTITMAKITLTNTRFAFSLSKSGAYPDADKIHLIHLVLRLVDNFMGPCWICVCVALFIKKLFGSALLRLVFLKTPCSIYQQKQASELIILTRFYTQILCNNVSPLKKSKLTRLQTAKPY